MSETQPKVRVGRPDDFDAMMVLLREMHADNGMAQLAEDKVVPLLQCALAQHRAVVGVIDGPDGIAASVGLIIGQWWYSHDAHLEDCWNFVREPYRHMRFAQPLIEFSKKAANGMGLPLLMGIMTEKRVEAKVRLYERKLPLAGALFLYRPEISV